jgi:hypothetical protein
MLDKLKAIVAAVVGFGTVWVSRKLGFSLDPSVEAAIVSAIMGVVVWAVPNIETA